MDDFSFLLEHIKNNNEQAFVRLVEAYNGMVFQLAFSFLKNTEEAEDLTQDVFLSVYENIGQFRNESSLKTWIYRITVNKSLNRQRKLKWCRFFRPIGSVPSDDKNLITEDTNPQYAVLNKELKAKLTNAIDNLPERQRTAFTLYKYQDLGHQEIAEIMGLSVSAVESLIHRAKQNLQAALAEFR
ncbi:MAG TPA: RNA polymerase sigma factor [Bacteroidales bacterium]|nr:RNA polymerase sigma factor [Bacteroidales bacterium]